MKRQYCTRCLNDNTVKGIYFDEQGVCNFCHEYENIKHKIKDYDSLEKMFLKRIENSDKRYKYDCAVGFSGGKDSTYVLYKLVKKYKLKVKAFTLDNGFLSHEAKHKIDLIIKELKVEHEYITANQDILFKGYQYTLKKFLSPCIACSFLGYIYMINYAAKIDAKVAVHGRSFPQMFRQYQKNSSDIFMEHIKAGLKDEKETDFKDLYLTMLNQCSTYISKEIVDNIKKEVISDSYKNGFREFVAYFLYHPYDKDEIIDFLHKNTSWKVLDEEEHFDCDIHKAAQYIKNITARRSHIMPEVSVSVREEAISREKGLELLKNSLIPYPKDEMKKMFQDIKLNRRLTLAKARLYGKRWW